ncbi:TetR/AcrR family transcriptional regulator [Acinetobacter sp. UBA6720]|uniref:TetR/AcrR family transcriptional regulator n=1 Tax=Acinetobacter sp. UBA6720 TaxID=1945953 RepID=UPI0025C21D34|nr:TetR/AcrR family transcriptional regulator [Acinetobacter sp. UBA6720]
MNTKTAKQKILDAAAILFYNDGITNTGINTITDKAKVAKMSLYNNFPTKSDLISSYIEARHQEWLELYAVRNRDAHTPVDKIIAVFEAYQDHAEFAYEKGFRGCGLLNAAAEFPAHSAERLAVKQHKDEIEKIISTQLALLIEEPERVQQIALMLSFLLEGSIARAGLESSSEKVLAVTQMVKTILAREIIA